MSLNFCDLLVLGSDLSGVMAATLLAKRGMNVLILDDEEEDDLQPNLVTGLGSRGFKSLLGKLMIPDSKLQILHENKIGCQVIFPKHRLNLQASRSLFFKEIEREFPAEKPLLEDLINEIDRLRENYLDDLLPFFPIVGNKEKKKFVRWFQNFPAATLQALWNKLSPTLQCFVTVQLRFFSRSPLTTGKEIPLLQLLLFLPPETEATFSIRGGVGELKKLFFDKLDYFGGMVHPIGNEPLQFLTKRREIRALQMARYNFPTRCRYLIANTDVQSFYKTLPLPFLYFPFNQTKKKIAALQPAGARGVVQYHTSRDMIPSPMRENVIYVGNPAAPLTDSNYLELNIQPLPKGSSENGDTLLTVSYALPGNELQDSQGAPQKVHALNNEIDARIHRILPFANSHLRRTFPLFGGGNPSETQELFPQEDDLGRFEKMVRRRVSYNSSLAFPSVASPFKNLFTLGPNVLDWLGMEGKMLAALRAVEMVWAGELKTRKP
jgi:hypothetical protein